MSAEELIPFLNDPRADVRTVAVEHIKNLTGTDEGIEELSKTKVVQGLTRLVGDQPQISKDSITALINLCTEADLMAQVYYTT